MTIGRIEQLTHYTRGPWTVDGRSVLGQAFDQSAKLIVDRVLGGSPEAAGENARLIAAAPEMYGLLVWLDRKGGLGLDVHEQITAVLKKVEAATAAG